MLGGSPWIVSKRQKTGVPFQIKLMDIPMQIIKRYEPYRISNNLFNIGSHDNINKRIKEVVKMCGIEKRTSFHLSRHTFAVLALNYGMPIESVSKILGHTNITTTQIYAKVTNTKLEHDISMFEMVVALAFRLNTYEASRIRQKVLESLTQRKMEVFNLFFALKSGETTIFTT